MGWIKTLSEQSSRGLITNSRKDLINDTAITSCRSSDSEQDLTKPNTEQNIGKRKKKKKQEENKPVKEVKKVPLKISANIKKASTT